MQKQKMNALRDAMTINTAKSNFFANMSREIRTSLNVIIGMTAIGKTSHDFDNKDICFTKIESASKHLLGIINDILDMSRIEANKFELLKEEFNLKETLQRAVSVIEHCANEKRQKLTVSIDKNIPEALIGDDKRFAQVVTNLLSNAVKFTPQNGSVSLDVRFLGEEDGSCIIQTTVNDSGIGINSEQKKMLFCDFYQAESDKLRKYEGTGLGLPISKNIAEMMGGTILVDSVSGQGSTFTFTAKIKRSKSRSIAEDTDDNKPDKNRNNSCNFKDRHILLAEDMEINREIMLALLEPTQVEIDCAENGINALKMFTASPEKYDLIIMDVQMPEMDGYEATRRIRIIEEELGRRQPVPIVAMTANVYKEDVEQALESGMNDHIGKPFDISILMKKLQFYLLENK